MWFSAILWHFHVCRGTNTRSLIGDRLQWCPWWHHRGHIHKSSTHFVEPKPKRRNCPDWVNSRSFMIFTPNDGVQRCSFWFKIGPFGVCRGKTPVKNWAVVSNIPRVILLRCFLDSQSIKSSRRLWMPINVFKDEPSGKAVDGARVRLLAVFVCCHESITAATCDVARRTRRKRETERLALAEWDKHQSACGGTESPRRRLCQEVRVRQGEANGPRPFSHFVSLSASAPSQRHAGRRHRRPRRKNKRINKQTGKLGAEKREENSSSEDVKN